MIIWYTLLKPRVIVINNDGNKMNKSDAFQLRLSLMTRFFSNTLNCFILGAGLCNNSDISASFGLYADNSTTPSR